MAKLLRADFARLFRNKLFLFLCAAIALLSVYLNTDMAHRINIDPEYFFFPFEMLTELALVIPVVVIFFAGTNFTDGVIRNKLFSGHSKTEVYCSELIVSVFVSTVFTVLFMTSGIRLLFISPLTLPMLLSFCLAGVLINALFGVFAVTVTFLCRGKAVPLVVAAVIILSMFLCTSKIEWVLSEPEYVDQIGTVNGEPVNDVYMIGSVDDMTLITVENPSYIPDGMKRTVLETVYGLLPTTQILTVSGIALDATYPDDVKMDNNTYVFDTIGSASDIFTYVEIGFILAFFVLCVGAGVLIFRKEDLK